MGDKKPVEGEREVWECRGEQQQVDWWWDGVTHESVLLGLVWCWDGRAGAAPHLPHTASGEVSQVCALSSSQSHCTTCLSYSVTAEFTPVKFRKPTRVEYNNGPSFPPLHFFFFLS